MEATQYIDVSELAKRLDVHPVTARRWCGEGKFPNATRVGREYRIPESDVRSYLDSRRVVKAGAA